jgi:ribonucleoside-diphosphate reductase alpha chain
MGKNYKIGVGDQKLYKTYDPKITQGLERRLLGIDVSNEVKKFDERSISLMKRRYFRNDSDGNIIEDIPKMFSRIAANISYADKAYGANNKKIYKSAEDFYRMMISADFIPNSPTLMNAGTKLQQLSACFVLPIHDDMDSILGTQKDAGMVHKSGGGTGFDWSELRMANDLVSTTYGLSSGPVRFLGAYDATTEAVNQGGTRRGANMGVMIVDHPDIIQFISEKRTESRCKNFNLSVSITDGFMEKVENDSWYTIYNSKKGKRNPVLKEDIKKMMRAVELNKINIEDVNYRLDEKENPIENIAGLSVRFNEKEELQLKAKKVFDYIIASAWKLGEPGVIFIDTINKHNSVPGLGKMTATNPCGEQPLLPYEACNLGSINLSNFVKGGSIDKKRLEKTVRQAVHFLDNAIDMSKFPLEQITKMVHKTRKIGLGVMGWGDALVKIGIGYDSEEALRLARDIMKFINETAKKESIELAKERGVFPAFKKSIYAHGEPMRNATRTTIAPTGSISQIARYTSYGIEPLYGVIYTHTDANGNKSSRISSTIKNDLEKTGLSHSEMERIMEELKKGKKLREIKGVPKEILKVYRTTIDIPIETHIKMQAAFQEYVDNAVSKTINMPFEATEKDVENAYKLAYKLGCKGITIYRDKSRKKQVLTSGLEKMVEEVTLIDVDLGSKSIKEGHDTKYYNIKKGEDTFHVTIVGDFWEHKEDKKIYILPSKIFQNTKPLGKEESTEFAQSGLDRTGRLKSEEPDWAGMIKEWKSVTGDKIQGVGPTRINSPSHGVGLTFEHYCLSRGVVKYNETNKLINAVTKRDLTKIEDEEKIKRIKKTINNQIGETKQKIYDNIDEKFECEECHCTEFHKVEGCSDPVCNNCNWSRGKCS